MGSVRIGQRIQAFRKAARLEQADVADEIDLSERQYQRIESGESDLNTATLFKISRLLGVSICDLFPDEGLRSVRDVVEILSRFESLSPVRKRVVLAVVFGDVSFLSDTPDLSRVVSILLKEEKPKK